MRRSIPEEDLEEIKYSPAVTAATTSVIAPETAETTTSLAAQPSTSSTGY